MEELANATGFEWDEGNAEKNWIRHRVTRLECEQIFFNQPLIVATVERPSPEETRFFALGQTDMGRELFLVFTLRQGLVRVISARDMSRKERRVYEDAKEKEKE